MSEAILQADKREDVGPLVYIFIFGNLKQTPLFARVWPLFWESSRDPGLRVPAAGGAHGAGAHAGGQAGRQEAARGGGGGSRPGVVGLEVWG